METVNGVDLLKYLPLVEGIAHSIVAKQPLHSFLNYEDLVAEGFIGMKQGVERFNPAIGVNFATFITPRIRGAMYDAIRNGDYLSRLGRRKANESGDPFLIGNIDLHHELSDPCIELPDEHAEVTLFWELVTRYLRPVERTILLLYYRYGWSMKKIAANASKFGLKQVPRDGQGGINNLSESRISQLLQRIKPKIKERLIKAGYGLDTRERVA